MFNIFKISDLKYVEKFLASSDINAPWLETFNTLNLKEKVEFIKSYKSVFEDLTTNTDLNEIFNDLINLENEPSNYYYRNIIKIKYGLEDGSYESLKEHFSLSYFISNFKLMYNYFGIDYDWVESGHKTNKQLKDILKIVANYTETKYTGNYELDDVTLFLYDLIQKKDYRSEPQNQ